MALSTSQSKVFDLIGDEGYPVTIRHVALAANMSIPNAYIVLDALFRRGLVTVIAAGMPWTGPLYVLTRKGWKLYVSARTQEATP